MLATLVVLGSAAGCVRIPPFEAASEMLPDSSGCYVLVFAEPRFGGKRDFLNGPARFATTARLPFRGDWYRQIRSARVGIGARVRVWPDENFRGDALTLDADEAYPAFGGSHPGIASIEIECAGARPESGVQRTDEIGRHHVSRSP
jgi:hypothetical protein